MNKSAEVTDLTENAANADGEEAITLSDTEAETVTDSDVSTDPSAEKAAPKKGHRRSKRAEDNRRAFIDKKEIHLQRELDKYERKCAEIRTALEAVHKEQHEDDLRNLTAACNSRGIEFSELIEFMQELPAGKSFAEITSKLTGDKN